MNIANTALLGGLVSETEAARIRELLETRERHLHKNKVRRAYYDGKNRLKDLGIAIPDELRGVRVVVGWPKKAVSALATRSRFDGFTCADPEVADVLERVVRECHLRRKYRQLVESELVTGCDFVTVSRGGEGEPPVIVTTHSAEDAAAVWDERLGRVAYGLVVSEYDKSGQPVDVTYHDSSTVLRVFWDGAAVAVERFAHRMGRPMMEAFAYRPTEKRPFGQSRITAAVRSITDSAVRESLRTEISAEFFTSPQKYLLGAERDSFDGLTKWEAYIGSIFAVGKDRDGDVPQFGQLAQGTMEPHVAYMRDLAARFSGETNVPLATLGVVHDNPSSAEAIYAASEPLIIDAEDLNDGNGESMRQVALMAVAAVLDVPLADLTPEQRDVVPIFRNPAMPSIVSQTDAMTKIASVVPAFAGTEVFFEQLGFAEDVRKRAMAQMQANANKQALSNLLAARSQARAAPSGAEA